MFPSSWEGSGQAERNRLNVSICLYTWNDAHFFINAASFLLGKNGNRDTEGGQKEPENDFLWEAGMKKDKFKKNEASDSDIGYRRRKGNLCAAS